MYEGFFRLKRPPFSLAPDPKFLYLSVSHREALAGLTYFIRSEGLWACLIAPPGLGKTTVVAALEAALDRSACALAVITPATPDYRDMLIAIARALGAPASPDAAEAALFETAVSAIDHAFLKDRRILLVVDEAHLVSAHVLERLRLLVDHVSWGRDPLKILLVGPPELAETLAEAAEPLRQRICVALTLEPLKAGERIDYLKARLHQAGAVAPNEVFTPGALRTLARLGRGVPRITNALANVALVEGLAARERPVRARTARRAVAQSGAVRQDPRAPIALAAALVVALALSTGGLYLGLVSGRQDGRDVAMATRAPKRAAPVPQASKAPVLALQVQDDGGDDDKVAAGLRGRLRGPPSVEGVTTKSEGLEEDAHQKAGNDPTISRP